MPAPSQRSALGALFFLICVAFAGVAYAAGVAHQWVIVAAALAPALWMGSLALQMLRRH